jgi:hypothetical protein
LARLETLGVKISALFSLFRRYQICRLPTKVKKVRKKLLIVQCCYEINTERTMDGDSKKIATVVSQDDSQVLLMVGADTE